MKHENVVGLVIFSCLRIFVLLSTYNFEIYTLGIRYLSEILIIVPSTNLFIIFTLIVFLDHYPCFGTVRVD